jgi:hypothetical protein
MQTSVFYGDVQSSGGFFFWAVSSLGMDLDGFSLELADLSTMR